MDSATWPFPFFERGLGIDITFWEVDHPSTANFRNRVWNTNSTASSPHLLTNLRHLSVDLSQSKALQHVLSQQPNYSTLTPTIVILEGVTMYLSSQQMQLLMQDVQAVTGIDSVLCFDMLELKNHQPDLGWATPLIALYLNFKGETWKMAMDSIRLQQFLGESEQWELVKHIERLGPASYAAIRKKG